MKQIKLLILSFSIILATFLTSCTPKITPAVVPITSQTPAITVDSNTNSAERLALGKTIFENSCGKCHDLHKPTDYNAQDWVGIMNWMAPKANLNEEQKDMVYDYVVSVKKEEKEVQ